MWDGKAAERVAEVVARRLSLEVVARQVGVEPLGVLALRGGRLGLRAPAPTAPAPHPDHERRRRDQGGDDRDQVGGEVEARALRGGEHLLAVLGDQGVLDLLLAAALGDQPADEDPLAVGLRRLGELQQGAADRAHHLVLDVGERGARLGRSERRRREQGGESQRQRQGFG